MSSVQKAKHVGYEAVRSLYNNTIRRVIPRTYGYLNGVKVRHPKLFDRTKRIPNYEQAYCAAVSDAVRDGDAVTLVGAGFGVSSVHALRAGASRVDAYEADRDRYQKANYTAQRHDRWGRIKVRYGRVAGVGWVDAPPAKIATEIPVERLRRGDVLALDCEGAEDKICRKLDDGFRTIVVETHRELYGTTPESIGELLPEYERVATITDAESADPGTAVATYERVSDDA